MVLPDVFYAHAVFDEEDPVDGSVGFVDSCRPWTPCPTEHSSNFVLQPVDHPDYALELWLAGQNECAVGRFEHVEHETSLERPVEWVAGLFDVISGGQRE